MYKRLLLLFFWVAIHAGVVSAASVTAVVSGNWSDASSWKEGAISRVPACGDTVIIPVNTTITVSVQQSYGCSTPLNIIIEGTLQFTTGNKLILPCGSLIQVRSSGIIKPGGGGGNSNYITICNTAVWNAGSGSLPGPVVLQVITLPIELVSFTATPSVNSVRLDWITATEINNDYFTIERSSDLNGWTTVASVDGAGNSSANLAYSLTDNSPLRGVSYYRLRQTDFDGKTSCSDPVAVDMKRGTRNHLISASLSEEQVMINYLAVEEGVATIVITDMSGAESFRGMAVLEDGINPLRLSTTLLSTGIYFVRVEFGQEIQGIKTCRF